MTFTNPNNPQNAQRKNKLFISLLSCVMLLFANTIELKAQTSPNIVPTNGNAGFGTTTPTEKVEINGKIKVTDKAIFKDDVIIDNDLKVKSLEDPSLSVNRLLGINPNGKIIAPNGLLINNNGYKLDVNGNFKANEITTSRIKPLPGDSLIHFGDSSIVFQNPVYTSPMHATGYHRIYTTLTTNLWSPGGLNESGLAIGLTATAIGQASYAIGHTITTESSASRAIAIGSGYYSERRILDPNGLLGFSYTRMPLKNTFANSVMLGANSPFSSIFIKPGNNEKAGLVGINNTNPTRELDVEGDVRVRNLSNSTGDAIVFADYDGTLKIDTKQERTPWFTKGNSLTDPNKNWLGTNDKVDLSIRTEARERIFVNGSNGQVIITNQGYTNPRIAPTDYIFVVNGKAIMEECEVRLKTGSGAWPDYVFNDDYKLKTIEEQKDFIQKNKHLPGFKTAKEIETKQSFGLGETQRLQQEKIEELYLYVIQLKEQNDALKKQVEQLLNK